MLKLICGQRSYGRPGRSAIKSGSTHFLWVEDHQQESSHLGLELGVSREIANLQRQGMVCFPTAMEPISRLEESVAILQLFLLPVACAFGPELAVEVCGLNRAITGWADQVARASHATRRSTTLLQKSPTA
jgi:hypothetical protein